MAVERLAQVLGQAFELGAPAPRLRQLVELDEVVDEPVPAERGQLVVVELAGERERLLGDAPALGGVLDVQQRGVQAHERGRQRGGLAEAARHRHRACARGSGPRPVGSVNASCSASRASRQRAQRAVVGLERRERLLEQRDVRRVEDPGRVVAPAGPERGAREALGAAELARQRRGDLEREPRPALARLPAGAAEREHDVGARREVVGPGDVERRRAPSRSGRPPPRRRARSSDTARPPASSTPPPALRPRLGARRSSGERARAGGTSSSATSSASATARWMRTRRPAIGRW